MKCCFASIVPISSQVVVTNHRLSPSSPHCDSMAAHARNQGTTKSIADNAIDSNSATGDESNSLSDPPQPSKTLALEPPDTGPSSPFNHRPNLVEIQFNDPDPDDSDGCVVCSPRRSDTPMSVSAIIVSSYVSRRRWKGKKQMLKRRAAQEKSRKKLEILADSFIPVPFVPVKSIDFATHEKLLRRLGLWDFVHIEFDRSIRKELLLQLVATFSHTHRCSYVNGFRIKVNRADLARALSLPVKKSATAEAPEEKTPVSEESIAFMEKFVSNWVLLHEDTWMMPSEILNLIKVIKDGHFERVDWPGLLWFMVEKELLQAPDLVNCYYASHLQYLIRSQREGILREIEANTENVEVKEQPEQEVEDEEDVHEHVKMGVDDEFQECRLEEHSIELTVEKENVEKAEIEKERVENKDLAVIMETEDEETEKLLLNAATTSEESFMRRCNFSPEVSGMQEEKKVNEGEAADEEKQVEGEEEEEQGCFRLSPKCGMLEEKKVNEGEAADEEEQVEGEDQEEQGCFRLSPKCGMLEEKKVNEGEAADEEEQVEGEDEEEQGCFRLSPKCGMLEEKKVNEGEAADEEVQVEGEEEEEQGRFRLSPKCGMLEEKKVNEGEAAEEKEQVEGEDEKEQCCFRLSPKCDTINGFSSGNFIQAMDVEQIPFPSGLELTDHSPVEFLSLRDDDRMISSGPLLSGNSNKRGMSHDNEDSHPSMAGGEKRLRMDGSSDFEMCVEQVQQWMGKARMMYAEKEQIYQEANVQQQYLIQVLQQRDNYIEHLRKSKFEEQQKKEAEIYRLEKELYMMGNLFRGYRKALNETHKNFAEYRACFPQPDEPLYKDVPGSGGLVVSSMEFEKMRLKQEEEDKMNRLTIEKKMRELEEGFVGVLEGQLQKVSLLNSRIVEIENEANFLRTYMKKGVEV